MRVSRPGPPAAWSDMLLPRARYPVSAEGSCAARTLGSSHEFAVRAARFQWPTNRRYVDSSNAAEPETALPTRHCWSPPRSQLHRSRSNRDHGSHPSLRRCDAMRGSCDHTRVRRTQGINPVGRRGVRSFWPVRHQVRFLGRPRAFLQPDPLSAWWPLAAAPTARAVSTLDSKGRRGRGFQKREH